MSVGPNPIKDRKRVIVAIGRLGQADGNYQKVVTPTAIGGHLYTARKYDESRNLQDRVVYLVWLIQQEGAIESGPVASGFLPEHMGGRFTASGLALFEEYTRPWHNTLLRLLAPGLGSIIVSLITTIVILLAVKAFDLFGINLN